MSNSDPQLDPAAQAVMDFWFLDEATGRWDIPQTNRWFMGGKTIDDELKRRFGSILQQAGNDEMDHWQEHPESTLALIVLLDQFNRNIHRGTAQAFACDDKALAVCKLALKRGFPQELHPIQRVFCYMPLEHDETEESQALSIILFEELVSDVPVDLSEFAAQALKSALEHKAIIDQFGRYPHRNAVLGRVSTPDEVRWLEDSNKRFGQ